MPRVVVRHLTRYRYAVPVHFGEHRMMIRPSESYDQRMTRFSLRITPEPIDLVHVHDVFGNSVALARFADMAAELRFESEVELDHTPNSLDGGGLAAATQVAFPLLYAHEDLPDLARSIERAHADPDRTLERWARRFVYEAGRQGALSLLSAMTRAIHTEFAYSGRLEVGTQTPLETLDLGAGSCRDFAVLMIEAARSLNLAARFVSGYIYSTAADRPERTGGGHTHAWVTVYLPRCGWVEFDPTNGIVGSTDLIRVAVGRDPAQALPLSGTWGGNPKDYLGMDVEVDVRLAPTSNNSAIRKAA